jgi:hypothetical protein
VALPFLFFLSFLPMSVNPPVVAGLNGVQPTSCAGLAAAETS